MMLRRREQCYGMDALSAKKSFAKAYDGHELYLLLRAMAVNIYGSMLFKRNYFAWVAE